MQRSRTIAGLACLAAAALAVRLAAVAVLSFDSPAPLTYEHGEIAENLLAGDGFSVRFLGADGPTSQQAPLYPLLLAGCYAVAGVGDSGVMLMQGLQCLAGALLVLVVVWLAWSLLPEMPSAGWIAGMAAALYPTHVYMVTHVQVALWAALLVSALLAVAAERRWAGTWRSAAGAGVLAGLVLLVEPILALALPVAAALWWQRAREAKSRSISAGLPQVACMAMVAALVISPWLVRNARVHGEPVFIKTTFGYAFWQGNNAASWGTDKIPKRSAETLRRDHDGSLVGMNRALWEARHETLYIDNVLLNADDYAQLAALTEPARCRLLRDRAWQFIAAHPGDYWRLCIQRLRYFLLWDETNPKAAHPLYRLASIGWLALAVVGVLAGWRQWRTWWPLWTTFAVVMLFHTLTIVSARFRIPVEPLAFVWGAPVVVMLIHRSATWFGHIVQQFSWGRHLLRRMRWTRA